jgi:hypothetical protein
MFSNTIPVRFFAFVLLAVFCLNAQTTITGTVKSTNGGVLANAKVSLAVLGLTTQAGSDGKYVFSNITSVSQRPNGSHSTACGIVGSRLSFTVRDVSERVSIDVFTINGIRAKSLVSGQMAAGSYALEGITANLAPGLYVVRMHIGNQFNSLFVSSVNHERSDFRLNKINASSGVLAKQQFEIVDTIVTELTGYYRSATPIAQYSGDYTIVLNVKPAAVDTKIYSERTMAQIDWGNTSVQVWDNYGGPQGTQLNGSYPDAFEGSVGWQAVCGYGWSSWVFKSNSLTGVDMSAFDGGSLHVAIKGSAPSIGMFVSSIGAQATTVDLSTLGYKADGAWHEMSIPLSSFGAIDLTQISVYAGFSAPADTGGEYASGLSYVMDDLYFKPK